MRRGIALAVFALAGGAALVLAVSLHRRWLEVHFAEQYCSVGRADEARMLTVRVLLALAGVALLWFARRLARRIAAASFRGFVSGAARLAIPALLALVLCDVVLRLAGHGVATEPPPNPLFRGEPEIGGVYVSDTTVVEKVAGTDVTTTYVIDRDGYRDARQDVRPDPGAPTLLFGGESIATGTTVTYEETYGTIVGARMGIQTVNVAVAGFANDQAYLWTTRALDRFPRTLAIVMILVPRQLERNLRGYDPRLAADDRGDLRWVQPEPVWWRASPLPALFEGATRYHGDEALRTARASFVALAQAAAKHGAQTLFLFTNYGNACVDPPGDSSIEHEVFDGTDLHRIRVDVDLQFHAGDDQHPDARGHALLAAAVEAELRRMGVHAP
jgi:hypothetical protein